MNDAKLNELVAKLGGVTIEQNTVRVNNPDRLRMNIHHLAEISAIGAGSVAGLAQFLIRKVAQAVGIYPASIHELYFARGRGEVPPTFTVPAVNLRALSFDAARAAFRAALSMDAAALIFELARVEMVFTSQKPAEYAASVLAAAIAEGYRGPVFLQGDHMQVSPKRYTSERESELDGLRTLIREAVAAGFFNIDIDASTLVDLNKPDIPSQQTKNVELTAMFARYLKGIEPKGVTISVGGEIGEVGGHVSTEGELRAFLDGFRAVLNENAGDGPGLSKISIHTGTTHGGVVLADGSIADVNVDFETLRHLSCIARRDFGLGGAVQHGASTLPESAFARFVEAETCEIHLATSFMDMYYEHIPRELRDEMYAYLREKYSAERKQGMTDEQFYHTARKYAIGAFKEQSWRLDQTVRDELGQAWEGQFKKLFRLLGVEGTREIVEQTVRCVPVPVDVKDYLRETAEAGSVSDLAD